ncbi:unnamed protein product [Phytomonas sp. Hart1]|nr:unnamed protein product [Phytomonas sp. Hart1]|eukprot:CCW69849.1 unnamed protein product [Phytomonas sp. isolate Hart1]
MFKGCIIHLRYVWILCKKKVLSIPKTSALKTLIKETVRSFVLYESPMFKCMDHFANSLIYSVGKMK